MPLAERRYAACDPDNRLIATQLEKAWETALQRVEQCRKRLDDLREPEPGGTHPDFTGLGNDLTAAWNAPQTTMRTRQRLVRALITEIVADVDEAAGDSCSSSIGRAAAFRAARQKAENRRAQL